MCRFLVEELGQLQGLVTRPVVEQKATVWLRIFLVSLPTKC